METPSCAIYARISSDDGTALGVTRQIADCRTLAARKGWSVEGVFVDNDISASTGRRRPEYQRMLEALKAGTVAALVVWDIDRLTRTPAELESFITLADAKGIALASVGGEVDLATPQGRLTARIKGSVARHEVEQSSRRLRRKFQERAEAGRPHGKVAYGYLRAPVLNDDGGQVGTRDVPHPEQSSVVLESTLRVLKGESIRSVVIDLNTRKVPSPRGGQWDGTMLRQVLLRERNAGRRVHQGKVIGRGDWEPIVEEDTFDRLVAMLKNPARATARGNAPRHLLSGIALCGRCGAAVRRGPETTLASGKVLRAHYRCPSCFGLRRNQALVDEVVEGMLIEKMRQPRSRALFTGNAPDHRRALEERATIEARLDTAADQFAEGDITGDQLRRITARLRPVLEAAEERVRQSSSNPELAPLVGEGFDKEWKLLTIEHKRELLRTVMTVTILPSRPGVTFNPEDIQIEWKG